MGVGNAPGQTGKIDHLVMIAHRGDSRAGAWGAKRGARAPDPTPIGHGPGNARRPPIAFPAQARHNRVVKTLPSGDQALPVRIHADRSAGTLEIDWADEHKSTFGAVGLRWLCPCAYCRGEAGMPGWLDTSPTLTAEQTRLVDVHLIGSYALAPGWADGHHTGYYPFVLLRDRCPCEVCSAGR